jgi:GNAT superfamily N-acetyltransferase
VTPDWRRTRLATVLLSAVVTTLRERGVTHVQTETDLHNADSHPLVANHGGIPVGRTIEWTWDSEAEPPTRAHVRRA